MSLSHPPPPTRPTVLKFGGAALVDGAGVWRACDLVVGRGGPSPVVVVSAAHGVTGLLDGLWRVAAGLDTAPPEAEAGAHRVRIRHRTLLSELGLDAEFLDRHLRELTWVLAAIRSRAAPSPADRDHVLSFGERMSARIVAAALTARGVLATPVDAFDLGLVSDSNHGRARPLPGTAAQVGRALEAVRGVPVVTGFVAVDARGRLTTLGRNGSDLSASLIGAAVGAGEVQFWKSVVGILTADPALVPGARPLRSLDYVRAAEFARLGAQVLHPEALEPLRAENIPARVLCFEDPGDAGTRIESLGAGAEACGIACGRDWVRLSGRAPHLDPPGGLRQGEDVFAPWSDELARTLADPQGPQEPVRIERGFARLAVLHGAQDSARGAVLLAAADIEVLAHRVEGPTTELIVVREADLPRAACTLHADLIEAALDRSPGEAASA